MSFNAFLSRKWAQINPEKAYLFAKSVGEEEVKEEISERMIARLKEIGYDGKRSFASFSAQEQEEIIRYLPYVTKFLPELFVKKPRE
jgi:hypothetical protein